MAAKWWGAEYGGGYDYNGEEIIEVEITMILEIITSNLLHMGKYRVEILVVARTWGDHMIGETMVLKEVGDMEVMEGETDILHLPRAFLYK